MFFDNPTQVKFWDAEMDMWVGGIAYHDVIICGCCGGVIELSDFEGEVISLPWVDIDDEIKGE